MDRTTCVPARGELLNICYSRITKRTPMKPVTSANLVVLLVGAIALMACASGQGRTRVSSPIAQPAPASVQALYESGRDEQVIAAVGAGSAAASPEDVWFAAQSKLRLGQRDQAIADLSMLRDASSDPALQAAARVAVARLTNDPAALEEARAAAAAFENNVFAQYEVGLSYLAQNDFMSAARVFDHCIDIAPTFAYAYYQAALTYDRLNRMDLMANRFDRFVRLAPNAPERPQVDTILRTVGGRQ